MEEKDCTGLIHRCDTGLTGDLVESMEAMSCDEHQEYVTCVEEDDEQHLGKAWPWCYEPWVRTLETCTDDAYPL